MLLVQWRYMEGIGELLDGGTMEEGDETVVHEMEELDVGQSSADLMEPIGEADEGNSSLV